MSQPSSKINAVIKKAAQEKKEMISEFELPMNEKKFSEMIEILESGVCTQLIVKFKKNIPPLFQRVLGAVDESARNKQKIEEQLQILASLFQKLIINKKLNNLHTLEIAKITVPLNFSFIGLTGEHFSEIFHSETLHTVSLSNIGYQDLLILLQAKYLTHLEISESNFWDFTFGTLKAKEILAVSRLKSVSIKNDCPYQIIGVISKIKHLSSLSLKWTTKMDAKILTILRESAIQELSLTATDFDIEGLIELLKTNRLQRLANPSRIYMTTSERSVITKEQFERLDQALKNNISLTEIPNHFSIFKQWNELGTKPKAFFDARENLNPNMMDDDMLMQHILHAVGRPGYKFAYAERNQKIQKNLQEASQKPEVSTYIKKKLTEVLDALKLEPAKALAEIIASYAHPRGTELLTVFNDHEAESLFPEEVVTFRKYGYFK